ncbi:MAG TPA: S1/P1 nuclease [Steroidobacteraceae bacterium]|jgi:hypothetical protein|nr:S1/P1 nuclease [Steroidobacteraceae bacterium]
MQKNNPSRLIAAFVLALPSLASGWAPQGHRTVGAIADQLLTPRARAVVAELLRDDRDKFGAPSGRDTLEEVSVWADEIRGTNASHGRWHYDDAPVCGAPDKARYCPDGECASEQIKRLTSRLADAHTPVRERNEALKWLVHLVGDLHQPLHAADNHDHGGTEVAVALQGVHTRGRDNLHRAWDGDLVRLALGGKSRQSPPRDIPALAREAQRLLAEAGQGTPDSWAKESNNLARNVAYRYPGFACDRLPEGIVVLDLGYQTQGEAVARERLLLAGGRLAGLLNQTLGTP